jgi:LacI family transcriptional regulator
LKNQSLTKCPLFPLTTACQKSKLWKTFSGKGFPLPTIRDVAKLAGVSIATVSRVANASQHPVQEQTRRRVLAAIEQLDYRPNALARGLLSKRSGTIGLLVPDIANPYYADIVRGIEDTVSSAGYTVIICNTDRQPQKVEGYLTLLQEKQCDGIIFAGGGRRGGQRLSSLPDLGIKVVLIGRHDVDLPAVAVDNRGGAHGATSHLIRQGHRRIGFIGGPPESTTTQDRQAGFETALSEQRISPDRRYLRYGDLRPQGGYQAMRELLELTERPTAVLIANDLMALGAIKAIRDEGLSIPRDLAVVGFDDILMASYMDPSLSTVAVPMYQLGQEAARTMLGLLRGDGDSPAKTLPTKLVVRRSSGPDSHTEAL